MGDTDMDSFPNLNEQIVKDVTTALTSAALSGTTDPEVIVHMTVNLCKKIDRYIEFNWT